MDFVTFFSLLCFEKFSRLLATANLPRDKPPVPAAVTMSVKRALADCVVLSLQDSSVFYPSCKGCLSRIDVEQQDGTR